jgi:Tfp pilus assembly protein PilF
MATDWLSAAAMLLSGLVVGFMFVYGMKRRSVTRDVEQADLEAKRDAVARELRDLQDRGGNEVERARLERELHGLGGPPAILPVPHEHTALRGFAYGAASVAILAALAWFVTRSTTPKENSDPLAQLEQRVRQRPDDLQLRDDLAKAYLDRENFTAVVEQTRKVLQRSPDDARALTYEALVRIAMGQNDAAEMMLQRATQSDANLLDAWVGLAWVRAQKGDTPGAEVAIAEAKRRHPEQSARLDELLARIHPSNPIHVTLKLADEARPPASGVVFVTARNEGVTSGPPVAVKRIPLGAFPMTVDITSADSMMGQQLPSRVRIEARVDSDGDPLTKSPGDLSAVRDGVALGSSVSLTLH